MPSTHRLSLCKLLHNKGSIDTHTVCLAPGYLPTKGGLPGGDGEKGGGVKKGGFRAIAPSKDVGTWEDVRSFKKKKEFNDRMF